MFRMLTLFLIISFNRLINSTIQKRIDRFSAFNGMRLYNLSFPFRYSHGNTINFFKIIFFYSTLLRIRT